MEGVGNGQWGMTATFQAADFLSAFTQARSPCGLPLACAVGLVAFSHPFCGWLTANDGVLVAAHRVSFAFGSLRPVLGCGRLTACAGDSLCRPFRAQLCCWLLPGVSFAALISPQAILCHRFAVRTGEPVMINYK